MLSIYQITRVNGILLYMPGGFVLFRGYLIRFADLTGFYIGFAFFDLRGGLLLAAY